MKKNGFVSTSIIYTFFIIFLLLMILLLNSYSRIRFLLEEYKYDIKDSFANMSVADINLYFMVWNEVSGEYELADSMPYFGYSYESNFSYCKNGSVMTYSGGNISVTASRRDSCYAYFKAIEKDITLRIYTKETSDSTPVQVTTIPNSSYNLTNTSCTNGANITFDDITRKFTITSEYKTVCEVEFTRKDMDIIINIYKEDANGTHEYDGIKYQEISDIPGTNFTYSHYTCENNNAVITNQGGELFVEATGKDVCNVYYKGGEEKVEIIIMQETDTGIDGYTTGKKYSRVYTIPSSGYSYVGYRCNDASATVTFSNGTLFGESSVQTTCYAYFNKYSSIDNQEIAINYYLEKSDGTYESVSNVPELGYVYNSSKSSCKNGSEYKVVNNIVYVTANTSNEVCDIYFDLANADIKVLVYVMNRETSKYELGDVPIVGYEMYSAGCTNGASIEYINASLKVTSEGPTVCTVYFR